jgi:DNA damage-binding protein 1
MTPQEAALTIGGVDEIQKLHIRSVPLHEQARRIAHQEETRTFGLITIANMVGGWVGREGCLCV